MPKKPNNSEDKKKGVFQNVVTVLTVLGILGMFGTLLGYTITNSRELGALNVKVEGIPKVSDAATQANTAANTALAAANQANTASAAALTAANQTNTVAITLNARLDALIQGLNDSNRRLERLENLLLSSPRAGLRQPIDAPYLRVDTETASLYVPLGKDEAGNLLSTWNTLPNGQQGRWLESQLRPDSVVGFIGTRGSGNFAERLTNLSDLQRRSVSGVLRSPSAGFAFIGLVP